MSPDAGDTRPGRGPVQSRVTSEADAPPDWAGPEFREIDDSIGTLLLQLVRAVLSMFVAFIVARLIAEQLLGIARSETMAQAFVFAPVAAAAIFVSSARPIRTAIMAQRRAIAGREEVLRRESERYRFASCLQDALEMAEDEDEGLEVVGRAFADLTDQPAELLLADSSRAHLRRAVVSIGAATAPGCGVDTPWSCPAVRRGQTLAFSSSEALDACPRLRQRPYGACSALCIPVTVLGTPMGVVHVTGAEHHLPDVDTAVGLEGLARQAGSRLGVLRAMASSELQASTDPLTGLLNRRSLENAVNRLRTDDTDFALAIVDLDHFKDLNDTFGHETGDRALRFFSKILRTAVRDHDVVARYGGEEFVVVFPRCSVVEAAAVVHRMRSYLADALHGGEVPTFTASYGLADSADGNDFESVFRLADAALFRAKQTGRDRLVIAGRDEPGAPEASDVSLRRDDVDAQVTGSQDGRVDS
ncbi:MAG TPA: sensor domain-containing diguanylate cyclase [Acidimicrobiia bacterium]|nr:sensor domain-containing diguanylate cyclase [Acidimicrobiia bacterium]